MINPEACCEMESKYIEIYKEASLSNFSFLLAMGFETFFNEVAKSRYCNRRFRHPISGLNIHITFYEYGLDSSFNAFIYSKKQPTTIDLPLFIPYYYSDFPKSKFEILYYPGTSFENRINSFCAELSSLFRKKPLSLILNNEIWFDGFFHFPQDQVIGVRWNPPPKQSF